MTDTPLHGPTATISFGRSLRYVAGYAILIAVMLVSPLFVFIPAALFYSALRHGRRTSWTALIVGAAIAGGIVIAGANAPQTTLAEGHMSVAYLAALILGIGLPAMVVVPEVERGESFGRILMTAVVFSIIGLTATEISMRQITGFSPYADQVVSARATAAKLVTTYQAAGIPSDAIPFLRHWMEIGVYCLPAFLLIDVVLVFLLSIVLFGRLVAWRDVVEHRGTAESQPYLFRNLALPEWLLFAFVIGGLSPLATGLAQRIAANVLAVTVFLYVVQGLAIFRAFLVAAEAGFAGTSFAYVILGLLTLTGIGPLLLGIAGLFDSFFDFRKYNRKDHSDESHFD